MTGPKPSTGSISMLPGGGQMGGAFSLEAVMRWVKFPKHQGTRAKADVRFGSKAVTRLMSAFGQKRTLGLDATAEKWRRDHQ